MHTLNLEGDNLQQQKTTPDATRTSSEQETEAAIQRLTKTGQQEAGKTSPSLTSLNFFSSIQMVGSHFGVNNTKAQIHPALYQEFRLAVMLLVV